ncbi:hypothetical protein PPYR_12516 [Photinus pyralis]|uniref:Uncharacterized protein n=1 Tax=Photinus pyralis TaxID=7054 RepID=A0A5N4A6D3_PHOPY|nr:flocculation protein FLO11-like [Photinus pyralis]KAB0792896.1 hypothetical protein PPYR_12516 [Photinus pyralis]
MRLKIIVTLLSISGGIICAQALQCQYCRGNACNQNDVPRLDCDDQVSTLPYNFHVNSNFENPIKACLELEYTKGLRRIPIRQCLLLSAENNVCNEIQFSLPSSVRLEKCNVRHKRDAEEETTHVLGTTTTETVLEDGSTVASTTTAPSTADAATSTSLTSTSPVIAPDESPEARTVTQFTEVATLSNEIPKAIEPVTEMTTVINPSTAGAPIESSIAPAKETTVVEVPKAAASIEPPVTQDTKVVEIPKAVATIEPSIALVTTETKISTSIAPVTEKTTIAEAPKTAALIASSSTTTVRAQTTTSPSHVAVKHGITTSTMMTTTPGGSSRIYLSLATLFTIVIYVL